ncbi:MAG TPA: hypothetical protein VK095_05430 [Beutenbergiaceae bacterium]|nr:hypothetical protein [Beutenbergiaceae bacterium]
MHHPERYLLASSAERTNDLPDWPPWLITFPPIAATWPHITYPPCLPRHRDTPVQVSDERADVDLAVVT